MPGHPSSDPVSAALRSNRLATAEFLRSGKLPRLSVERHLGTGRHTIAWLGEDCEDGMRRAVRGGPVAARRRL